MNKFAITFKINASEKIMIEATDSIKEMSPCCYEVSFVFIKNSTRWVLWHDFINVGLQELKYHLEKTLNNEFKLHESINKDIGFLSNEESQGKQGFFYKKVENYNHWIGQNYALWSSDTQAWLYNNDDGEIILEITPSYPWHYNDPKDNECFVPYEDWIKDYKPLLITKIPKEIAKKWLKQCDVTLQKLQKNIP